MTDGWIELLSDALRVLCKYVCNAVCTHLVISNHTVMRNGALNMVVSDGVAGLVNAGMNEV